MPIISKETWDKLTQEEKREKQDERWNSSRTKEYVREEYERIKNETTIEAKDFCKSLEDYYGKHNLQSKLLTYEDVEMELFPELRTGVISVEIPTFSKKEAEKLEAIGRLLATAKFLNGDWKPDWSDSDEVKRKWYIYLDEDGDIAYCWESTYQNHIVYFRNEELAKQAIQILGEDTVRMALTTDY